MMIKKLWRKWFCEKTTFTVKLDPALVANARSVVAKVAADIPNASSENKHARAFAWLSRVSPNARKRDVSIAIELVLRNG